MNQMMRAHSKMFENTLAMLNPRSGQQVPIIFTPPSVQRQPHNVQMQGPFQRLQTAEPTTARITEVRDSMDSMEESPVPYVRVGVGSPNGSTTPSVGVVSPNGLTTPGGLEASPTEPSAVVQVRSPGLASGGQEWKANDVVGLLDTIQKKRAESACRKRPAAAPMEPTEEATDEGAADEPVARNKREKKNEQESIVPVDGPAAEKKPAGKKKNASHKPDKPVAPTKSKSKKPPSPVDEPVDQGDDVGELVLGCAKCRRRSTGCSQCKNPRFTGRRGPV